MPAAEMPACVFCGEPIGPGEVTAGRAPMAAHATCADAALADDSHWDAISSASGKGDAPAVEARNAGERGETMTGAGPRQRGAGCLGAALLGLALGVVALRAGRLCSFTVAAWRQAGSGAPPQRR